MKKIIATLILSALMLTACSTDKPNSDTSSDPASVSSSSEESSSSEPDTASSSESSVSETSEIKEFPKFTSKTVNDEDISNDVFAKYDLTMINIWATWCGPCVGEMPELGEMHKNLPENLNLVTIAIDAADSKEDIIKFMQEKKAEMPVIVPDETITKFLKENVNAVPTTIFVDKDGKIVGDIITGAPSEDVEKSYRAEFDKRLEMIK